MPSISPSGPYWMIPSDPLLASQTTPTCPAELQNALDLATEPHIPSDLLPLVEHDSHR